MWKIQSISEQSWLYTPVAYTDYLYIIQEVNVGLNLHSAISLDFQKTTQIPICSMNLISPKIK